MIKKTTPKISLALALAVSFALAPVAGAAPNVWTNSAGGNWSVPGNWSTGATPQTSDDVQFGYIGAGSPNTDDLPALTIDSLLYDQTNGLQQTTVINPGLTLTISSSVAAGTPELQVNSTSGTTTSSTLIPAAIQGATSSLVLTGSGDINIGQGNGTAGAHMATLDMSGLGTFNANVGRLLVGVGNSGNVNRASGTLYLAATNVITLTGASPQVEVQESPVNANGGTVSTLYFGQTNALFGDTMRFGGDKGNGTVTFNSAFAAPTLEIRNADGVSPCTVIDFGYNAFASSGNSTVCTADFSHGSVDILASQMHLAQGNPGTGTGSCTSTLTLGAGTLAVGSLYVAYGNAAAANTGGTTANLYVNNNGLFSTGAVVSVTGTLTLARTNGPISAITGTLNIGSDGVGGAAVYANTIAAGGGMSTINLDSGALTVTNTVGSLAFPIRVLSVGSSGASTLNVPLSGSGSAIVVSNLTTAGANLVNITAVPGIASYPATFTLIQYQGAEAGNGAGTFTLGSLPAASPSYAGTILDTGNGVVQVKLTSGPTAILATTWTGATDNNWDYSTMNWLYQGVAADFVDGRATLFNDSTTVTNLLLDGALSPSSITVTNNTGAYTFGGTGNIAGSALLTKSGSSSLTLDNSGGNNNISTVVINGGTLQLGAGDAGNGGLSGINITNNGALVVDRADDLTLSSAISGSGTVSQIGGGTLVLSGANTYSGATTVTNGTLELDQTTSGAGPVTATAGTVLSGSGVAGGPVTVSGELSPGTPTATGTFQAEAGLTLVSGSTLNFGLSASDPNPADGVDDLVAVTGNLTANNNAININIAGTPVTGSQYTLMTYTGNLSGGFNPVVTGTHFATTLDSVSTHGSVLLNITGSSGYNLKWSATADGNWNTTTANWVNLANSTASTFLAGDSVLFDDTGASGTVTIPAGVTVYPSVITNSSEADYTITGAGSIGGALSMIKTNTGTLALDTVNSFSGTIDVQGGVLQPQIAGALGSATLTIESNATLDLDNQNLGAAAITVSGPGSGGQGAIINSSASFDTQAFRQLILAGDTTLGGTGGWEMNNSGGTASLSTGGNAYNLTKVGANEVDLQNLSTFDAALANIDIQAGTLLFDGLTPDMGDPTYTLTVEAGGAQLQFGGNNVTWNKIFVFNGDGSSVVLNNGTGGNNILAGPVTLNGNCLFDIGGTQLGISGNISGPGGITKSGGSPLIYSGAVSYTGDTVINVGTLQLMNGAMLTTSSNITIAAGATLDMQSSALVLVAGQTLSGNGSVINGTLTAGAGSTVSPGGLNAAGALSISGAITLSGTNIMELDANTPTNDVLSSAGSITYGGTLNLVNLDANPIPNNTSFKLFNGTSYHGSFSSIVPATPGAGQVWNTSALATSGTISVVAGSSTPPSFGTVSRVGTSLVFSGSNGLAADTYYVLTSTNVKLARASWTPIATNTFDANGNFSFTNSLTPPAPQRFFLIEQQ
jgi:fibronectin-binding autotransporter adhesin